MGYTLRYTLRYTQTYTLWYTQTYTLWYTRLCLPVCTLWYTRLCLPVCTLVGILASLVHPGGYTSLPGTPWWYTLYMLPGGIPLYMPPCICP